MKRRILVLSVLLFALFAFSQPASVATSACDCWCSCSWESNACYDRCDQDYPDQPRRRMDCYDECFWGYETCTWMCN